MASGRPQIRVLYPPIAPAINRCPGKFPKTRPSAQCTQPGFMVEILAAICDEVGYEIVPVRLEKKDEWNGTHFGAMVGNKTGGFLPYILEKKVDTIAVPFHDYGSSRSVFDLSSPIYNTTAGFFYKKQLHRGNNWLEFFKVYNRAVWMAMGMLLLVVIIFLHVAKCLELRRGQTKKPNLKQRARFQGQIAWYALQFMLGHPHFGKFKSGAVNLGLMVLASCYGIFVLGIYGSWILSLKLDPIVATPVKDMDHLARLIRDRTYHMIATPKKALDFALLKRANLPILRTITDALDHNPIHLTKNDEEIREHLMFDRSVVYVEADEQLYLDLQKQCGIDELQEHIFNLPAVFIFLKGNPLMEPINEILNRYLGLDYDEINSIPCSKDRESQILPYFGLSLLWLGMCVLGMVVLLFEIVVHRFFREFEEDEAERPAECQLELP